MKSLLSQKRKPEDATDSVEDDDFLSSFDFSDSPRRPEKRLPSDASSVSERNEVASSAALSLTFPSGQTRWLQTAPVTLPSPQPQPVIPASTSLGPSAMFSAMFSYRLLANAADESDARQSQRPTTPQPECIDFDAVTCQNPIACVT